MFSVLHLSDIHIKSEKDSIFSKKDKIVDAIKNRVRNSDKVLIIISGDLVFSGKEEQFYVSIEFIEDIRKELSEYSGTEVSFFVVPGNHDCEFSEGTGRVRSTLVEQVIKTKGKDIDQEIIEHCCRPLDNYYSFLELTGEEIEKEKGLFFKKSVELKNHNVTILGYNTAWLSRMDEKREVFLPVDLFPPKFEPADNDFTISVFHHPYNWLHEENYRAFRSHVEESSNLVLTGHEHVNEKREGKKLDGEATIYMESGVLQDSKNPNNSEFNLIQIDLKKLVQKNITYNWDGTKYVKNEESEWISLTKNKITNNGSYKIDETFKYRLKDPGATFSHPRVKKIELGDILIYPQLRKSDSEDGKNTYENIIETQEILNSIKAKDEFHILLTGEEKSGKTTLCKVFFKEFFNNGLVPIYIEGHKFKETSDKHIKKLLNKSFIEQYSDEQLENLEQEDVGSLVVIVDNIDRSKLNVKFRGKLITKLNTEYPKTIITGDDFFKIEELMRGNGDHKSFENYEKYEILEFGHYLRAELIKKWNKLGREEIIDEKELTRHNDKAKKR